jgi:hypothetical protein
MKTELIKLSPREGEKLQAELRAIAEHHDECVHQCLPEDWAAAGYHHERAEWARDFAGYVECRCAVGKIDLPELVGELREHRERLVDAAEAMKESGDFCERMERRFNGEAVEE